MSDYSVMIDLETLSTERNASIVSIGAVKFNSADILDEFYVNIDPKSCIEAGLHISVDTLNWWRSQAPEAYAALKNNRTSLSDALDSFSAWYGEKSVNTFSNGSDFDNVILVSAYKAVGKEVPFKFYHSLCYRTIVTLLDKRNIDSRTGIKHNALDDARNQAVHLQRIVYA